MRHRWVLECIYPQTTSLIRAATPKRSAIVIPTAKGRCLIAHAGGRAPRAPAAHVGSPVNLLLSTSLRGQIYPPDMIHAQSSSLR